MKFCGRFKVYEFPGSRFMKFCGRFKVYEFPGSRFFHFCDYFKVYAFFVQKYGDLHCFDCFVVYG